MAVEWRNIGDTDFASFSRHLKGSPLEPFTIDLWKTGRPNTKLLLAQMEIESNLGTSALYKVSNNPLGLRPWYRNEVPVVPGKNFLAFKNPVEAVKVWKNKITDHNFKYVNTVTVPEYVHVYAPTSDGNDEGAYVKDIMAVVTKLPTYGGIVVPTGIPVVMDLLPNNSSNGPTTKLPVGGPLYIVVHETGNTNFGANAASQIRYMKSAEAKSRRASYHLSVDDHQIVQGRPLDVIAYHAGDGCDNPTVDIGCFRSVAIETCINRDGNKIATRRNLAELIARIAAGDESLNWGDGHTKDRFDINHIKQHNQVSDDKKNCPAQIRNEGFWATLMTWVDQAWLIWNPAGQPPEFPRHRARVNGPIESKIWQDMQLHVNHFNRFLCTHGTSGRTYPDRAAPRSVIMHKKKMYTFDYVTEVNDEPWLVSKAGTCCVATAFRSND